MPCGTCPSSPLCLHEVCFCNMPIKRGRAGVAKPAAARRRAPKADASLQDEDFFVQGSDDERSTRKAGRKAIESEEEEEQVETAEEKRLRLAKAYLSNLQATLSDDDEGDRDRRGVTGGSDEDDDGGDGEDGSKRTSGYERLSARLKVDASEAMGRVQRKLAHSVLLPPSFPPALTRSNGVAHGGLDCAPGPATGADSSVLRRGHRLTTTAVCLAPDESCAWTVSKDGSILKWDLASGRKKRLFRPGELGPNGRVATPTAPAAGAPAASSAGPDWVKKGPRVASQAALLAVAVSSDGALLAVGGGDRKVHLFDARTDAYLQAFPGHRDSITALAWREGSHTLASGSADRTVKLWSMDDRAYMDTLFGHQAEVLSLDMLRADRAVSVGADRSCRVWKVPEESQLIFRHAQPGAALTLDCCRYVTSTDWLTGSSDGSLQLWTQLKRKPLAHVRHAHGPAAPQPSPASVADTSPGLPGASAGPMLVPRVAGDDVEALVQPDVTGWLQSVAVARGSDLVASGAGDGVIRLWAVSQTKGGSAGGLQAVGALPARGWVNGLAIGRSGRVIVAAVGQEPRMGRWAHDKAARNGLLIHRLTLRE
ncbi:WD40-repeat-containing domain protein [Haematococcus lacustris]